MRKAREPNDKLDRATENGYGIPLKFVVNSKINQTLLRFELNHLRFHAES